MDFSGIFGFETGACFNCFAIRSNLFSGKKNIFFTCIARFEQVLDRYVVIIIIN